MSDPDKMVFLGEIPTRDSGPVKAHRDYEDLVIGDFRFTPEGAGVLVGLIVEWEQQFNGYRLRESEDNAGAGADFPEACEWHGGEGSSGPGCPDCAYEDERRAELCLKPEEHPVSPAWPMKYCPVPSHHDEPAQVRP